MLSRVGTSILSRSTTRLTRRAAPALVTRSFSSRSESSRNGSRYNTALLAGGALALTGLLLSSDRERVGAASVAHADGATVDWDAVRRDVVAVLDDAKYDDGSYGPVVVRLAWHACGTYDRASNSGGSDGATMRFEPESAHGANAGLAVARALLAPIQARHPGLTVADLWQFAAVVAIEEMGGPKIPFRPGRMDKADGSFCTPDGRLPDATQGAQHVRDVFYRMGFNDQEIVALLGAHAIGRCHTDRSGFDGPWTKAPTMFSNELFRELIDNKWTVRKWKGPLQYQDPDDTLMMLPTDMVLLEDEKFRVWTQKYYDDEELFFRDFAKAFQKLQENGVPALASPWYKFW